MLRSFFRGLVREPLFALTAVGTLALGIGANVAIFSVVYGVLLEPLPFDDEEGLVGVWHTAPGLGFEQVNVGPAMYFTYREQNRTFEDIGFWDNRTATITGIEEPEVVPSMLVTAGLLRLLRVQPRIGRGFSEEDDSPISPETVMLGHEYWQRRFGGDALVLGTQLRVDGKPREVIGVLPAWFSLPRQQADVFLPARFNRAEVIMGNFDYQAIARLAPGATVEAANADVERMAPLAVEEFPGGLTLAMMEEARFGPDVHPLKEDYVGDVGKILWVLLATVGLVLLIACANVANLFMVRAEGRNQEVAVRTALGAGRGHIARQFLCESVALGLLGGLVGVVLAAGGIRLLLSAGPQSLPRLQEIGIDGNVLLFALAVSVVAGLLFGLFPVFRLTALDVVASLKEGGRGGSAGHQRHRARSALVIAQVALALVLLSGSGLMVRSLRALRDVHPGFERPEEVMTFRVAIPNAEIEDDGEAALAYERIVEGLKRIPGVSSVGASFSLTMDGWDSNDAVWVEERPVDKDQLPPIRRMKWIAGDYFETMQNPLLAGRGITWADIHERAPVVVVTENFAAEYWRSPSEALGKRVSAGDPENTVWREIVGVVGNVHDDGPSQDPVAVVYWPLAVDHFRRGGGVYVPRSMAFALRSIERSPEGLVTEARNAVWSVNRNLPIASVRTLREILDQSLAHTSFTVAVLLIAAGVALALGIVGVYGVISYIVTQRTREIGVRMALGAAASDVLTMVLGQGMTLAVLGVALGLVAALGLTRLMSALLFGVDATDPLTFGAVATALLAVVFVASYLPARRAARTSPIEALRNE